ncbi:MAG: 30S ribosomal protein S4 [Pseudomonadota bacterium]
MATYTGAVCRLCRRENMKLFLKGDRCYSDKCAYDRRGYPPGQHGQRRHKTSDYGIQLREKQKVKRIYGLTEKQFHLTFERADCAKGITGTNLLVFLERRMDNVIYRLGFANSRSQARQLVRHGHFLLNGKKLDIPSAMVTIGDEVAVAVKSRETVTIKDAMDSVVRRGVPQWLTLDKENFKGAVNAYPTREELTMPMAEQLIVELYSR